MKTPHPYLFAVFPILYLYIINTSEVAPSDLVIPIGISLGATAILLLILRRATGNIVKSALTATGFLGFFYSYALSSSRHLMPLCIALLVVWIVLVWRSRRNLAGINKYANIVAVILVAIVSANFCTYQIHKNRNPESQVQGEVLATPDKPRDIYYIILDGYGRQDILRDTYGFDNSEFIKFLTDRGFYVASKSRSNYPTTTTSLPSSLNMSYFTDEWAKDTYREQQDFLVQITANNEASRLLKSAGYHYIYVSSGLFHDEMKQYAEVYMNRTVINNFITYLCWNTAASPIMAKYAVDTRRERVLYAFNTLTNMHKYNEPIFVFSHVFCPHYETIFLRDGSKPKTVEKWDDPSEQLRKSHMEQVMFTNTKTEEMIDAILARSDPKPIIVIQGDHENGGNAIAPYRSGVNILNAYYLPDGGESMLYDTISPVNTFRVIFNYYFGTDFKLLEDKSYCYGNYPFKFMPVPECGRCYEAHQ